MTGSQAAAVVVAAIATTTVLVVLVTPLVRGGRSRRSLGTSADRVTFATLHEASLAAPPLRHGLTATGATKASRHLHILLGTSAIALTDGATLLAWEGAGEQQHASHAVDHGRTVLQTGHTQVLGGRDLDCNDSDCSVRAAVVAALTVEDRVVGALTAYAETSSAGLVRATEEVARWVSAQLELAELESSRTRLAEAEVRALRAQISPHFIYNSLTAIASFVRTDPERARELLMEFADFTRYSFRRHGEFTTLAEELRSIDRYLLLERARFGDRLHVTVQVAPEVLAVTVPFLCIQPLVENAVQHGLEGRAGTCRVTIVALDQGNDALISVEDDGSGIDPEAVRRTLAGQPDGESVGLCNVDERLRHVYGDEYGLVVETALGAGTKVSLRVPKYRAGVHV